MNIQQTIAANVAARGYRDGWTLGQFVARQIAKATEELNEASSHIVVANRYHPADDRHIWLNDLSYAGEYAQDAFDDNRRWASVDITAHAELCSELADLAVVLFTAADALGFDLAQAALDKSAADVTRGVRA